MFPCVEYGRGKRHQTHENDVRKHAACQKNGQIKGLRIVFKAGSNEPHHDWSKSDTQKARDKNSASQKRKHIADEGLLLAFGLLFLHLREHRNECLTECAFGKKAAQHVRNTESDVKSVGRCRHTKIARDQHIADQTSDARQQRENGNRSGRLE